MTESPAATPSTAAGMSSSDSDPDSIGAVTVKLSKFYADAPRMWFLQAESQFNIRGITSSRTKYDHVTSCLTQEVIVQVADVIEECADSKNSDRPYEKLKERLLLAFCPGPYKLLEDLLDHPPLGDRRPSKMMNDMLHQLPPGEKPTLLFNAVFLRRLPAGLRQVLATQKHETACALGAAADVLWDAGRSSQLGISSIDAGRPSQGGASGHSHASRDEDDIHAVPAAPNRRGRSPPCAAHNRVQTPGRLCFYHQDEDASKCSPPCSWTGNGQGVGRRRRN